MTNADCGFDLMINDFSIRNRKRDDKNDTP